VPDKLTMQLHQLYVLAIQLTYNFRTPGIIEAGKFFEQVYFIHIEVVSM
jgi:hypothetical protein